MRLPRPAKPPARPFTARELYRLARNPAAHAPRAADVLTPEPADLAALTLESCGAKDVVVRDGVVGASLSGRAFIGLGEELLRRVPLRDVRLVAVLPYIAELARCPHLTRLRRLDLIGNRIRSAGLKELAASPYLAGLRELGLSGNDLTDWSGFENLTVLELADNGLATVPRLPHITSLDVSRNPLRTFDFPVSLERLKASGCGLPVEPLRPLHALLDLDASFNVLGPGRAAAVAELTARLLRLNLSFNDIESGGAEALALADSLASVVSLDLRANRIGAAGAVALSNSFNLAAVENLNLAANPIGDRGAVALVSGEAFASLSRLDVSNCGITNRGLAGLCATDALGGLRSLSLAWNPCGDIRPLARCPDLAGLEALDLTGTRLDFAAAVALAESPHLVSLRSLTIGENPRLPADAARLIAERFGKTPV